MKLNQSLEGKNVKITCIDGEVFTGIVSDYIFPDDNEPEGVAAIDIDNCPQKSGDSDSFNENDIDDIKIIEQH